MGIESLFTPFGVYFLSINSIAFLFYGADKYKAIHHAWRIPERVLLLTALMGGAFGSLFAMYFFHHKTKKLKFLDSFFKMHKEIVDFKSCHSKYL